jgi:hypothetical protein
MPAQALSARLRCGPNIIAQQQIGLTIVEPGIRIFLSQRPTADLPAEVELYVDDAIEIEFDLNGDRDAAGPRSVIQFPGQPFDQRLTVTAYGVANTRTRVTLVIPRVRATATRFESALREALRRA